MSAPNRPPVTTPFWIGDLVYLVRGTRKPWHVKSIEFTGDPAYPRVTYNCFSPKDGAADIFDGWELTKTRPAKEF